MTARIDVPARIARVRALLDADQTPNAVTDYIGISRVALARWLGQYGEPELSALFAKVQPGERKCVTCKRYFRGSYTRSCRSCVPLPCERAIQVAVKVDGMGRLLLVTKTGANKGLRIVPLGPAVDGLRGSLWPRRTYRR